MYSASEMDAVSACAAPDTVHRTDAFEYRATANGWNAGGHGSCHRPYSVGGRGTVRFGGKRPRVFRLKLYAIGSHYGTMPAIV